MEETAKTREILASKMTPKEILSQETFGNPSIIRPDHFKSFDELSLCSQDIRDLKLLPVKDDAMYLYYKQFDREDLANEIKEKFRTKKVDIFIERNKFPYWLPDDVRQEIIWINDNYPEEKVVDFIEKIIEFYAYPDYILFERSSTCAMRLVKGTIPQVRHIHIWTKIVAPDLNKTGLNSV